MAATIRIIHARDFIKVTAEGQLDLERAKELLLEAATVSALGSGYDTILDTREAESEMSTADLWYLAKELSDAYKAFSRKTAVLCPLKQFDRAGFFALCAQNRGLDVRAFTSFEDAFEWLIAVSL
jgi:hypothetical protein